MAAGQKASRSEPPRAGTAAYRLLRVVLVAVSAAATV